MMLVLMCPSAMAAQSYCLFKGMLVNRRYTDVHALGKLGSCQSSCHNPHRLFKASVTFGQFRCVTSDFMCQGSLSTMKDESKKDTEGLCCV